MVSVGSFTDSFWRCYNKFRVSQAQWKGTSTSMATEHGLALLTTSLHCTRL